MYCIVPSLVVQISISTNFGLIQKVSLRVNLGLLLNWARTVTHVITKKD